MWIAETIDLDNHDLVVKFLKQQSDKIEKLEKENKQLHEKNQKLQERNDRQAKQLDNLYTLIEKQDWKTLKGIIQELQECEEQLQREWGTYGDVE